MTFTTVRRRDPADHAADNGGVFRFVRDLIWRGKKIFFVAFLAFVPVARADDIVPRKPPNIVLREVVIIPADDPENPVYLLTTLLDLDASIIGILYGHRWQIELFFRWMKSYARFDHLISHTREGVLLNFYVAVIGVTLMYLHMGYRPSKYMFLMMGMVANGAATLEEIMPILRERERQSQLQRDRVARKRAEKPK